MTAFQMCENAIEALAAFHSVEIVEAIVQCLNDAGANVRKAAATALKSLGWKPSKMKLARITGLP